MQHLSEARGTRQSAVEVIPRGAVPDSDIEGADAADGQEATTRVEQVAAVEIRSEQVEHDQRHSAADGSTDF